MLDFGSPITHEVDPETAEGWFDLNEGDIDLSVLQDMSPTFPYPSYCVSPRCGWCRFTINTDELMTARSFGGTETAAFAFSYPHENQHIDEDLPATLWRCDRDHNTCATTGYHVECSEIASSFGLGKNDFLDVARYSYEPSAKEDDRRREWILNHLQQLMGDKIARLPAEILLMVTKYLVPHYAIASTSHVSRTNRYTIEPLKDVWATYFNLDGVAYIASLSNSPRPGSRLLWNAPKVKDGNVLFISEDHLGIRHIINDRTAVPVEEQGSSGWWRTLPIDDRALAFSGDGLKLRSVIAAPINPTICWPYPMTPTTLTDMAYHVTRKPSSSFSMMVEARLVPLDFNEPNTIGLSTCWYRNQLIDLHLHKSGESLDFYREVDANKEKRWRTMKKPTVAQPPPPHWIYHPLEPGENVEQIWLRTGDGPEDKNNSSNDDWRNPPLPKKSAETAIALVTSQSRTLAMGGNGSANNEWRLIARENTDSPMRVFFNPCLDGISLFAAPTVGGSGKDSAPAGLLTETDCSEASLEDVKEIVVCKERSVKGLPLVTGILFRYVDGKQACVGEFRFDRTEASLSVAGSSSLYLGVRDTSTDLCVEEISLYAPKHEGNLEWKEIPWKKTLVWSFTSNYSQVAHGYEEDEHTDLGPTKDN
ncbi:hypothetical protein FSARC_3074 [Fusarium sarcochroum]|uniref:F-box domain-containing protein n=1 Tax=Fusarium sarcochroum TaxID=1208366 RepID=A0A8H4U4R3_9HYPO|nr:hypothetical protein FSARC_3074 [Fusarium sarcochroum]